MSLAIEVKQQFAMAARHNPALQAQPVLDIELATFDQILHPIHEYLASDPTFDSRHLDVSSELQELRRMCLEAQAAHTTKDSMIKGDRSELLNVLQSVAEKLQEADAKGLDVVSLDKNELFVLSKASNTVRAAAEIHGAFLGNADIALAMDDTADYIQEAQARGWTPVRGPQRVVGPDQEQDSSVSSLTAA